MKNNKGFTLIEILISIALITIMSTYFLMLMANHLTILNKTKAITEEVFLAQRELEEEIDSVKKEIIDINNGETPDNPRTLESQTIFTDGLGGISVSYYETEIYMDDRHYYTLVSNIKPEPLEVISIASIDSNMKYNNSNVEYGYGTPAFSILGEFSNSDAYKYDHLLNQVEWYVSSEEFVMPLPKSESFDMNDNFDYNSYYFPVFPDDYTLIDNETIYNFGDNTSSFELLSNYKGRHILFSVTPAAKSGKLGEQMASDPIFISGVPVIDDLVIHLDASYIDLTMLDEVQIVGESSFVWKWYDISSIIGHTSPTVYAQKSGTKPVVKRTDAEDGFKGQYVSFDADEKLELSKNISGDLTVISVIRNRSVIEEAEYFSHEDTVLKLEPSTDETLNLWRVATEMVPIQGNSFKVGGEYIDIAEIIVYQGVLNETEEADLDNYLINKYQ